MTDDIEKAIERAKELDRIATPGKWRLWSRDESGIRIKTPDGSGGMFSIAEVCSFDLRDENAAFIAESRTLLPQLVAEVELLTEKCADLEADAEGTDIYIGVMADTLGVKRIGKDLSCVGHAIERLVKERTMPEWRPLSVLTCEVAKRCKTWVFSVDGDKVPTILDITHLVEYCPTRNRDEQFQIAVGISISNTIPTPPANCRPVDREGVPVPWGEVGL